MSLLKDLLGRWKTRFFSCFKKCLFWCVDVVNKCNNTVHRSIKMKPIDSYAEYNEDFNEKDPKFKFGDRVRISKYKIIFAKGVYPKLVRRSFCC